MGGEFNLFQAGQQRLHGDNMGDSHVMLNRQTSKMSYSPCAKHQIPYSRRTPSREKEGGVAGRGGGGPAFESPGLRFDVFRE